jgi:hypothetical protein
MINQFKSLCIFFTLFPGAFSAQASEYSIVQNGPHPTQSIRSWHLKELWKVGPDDDLIFGQIVDIKMDSKSNTFILDYQTQEVSVINSEGFVIKVMGRQGDGPGETQLARKIFLQDDGGVGLLEAFPGSIVWLKNNGDPDGKTVVSIGEDEEVIVGCMSGTRQFGHLVLVIDQITFKDDGPQSTTQFVGILPHGGISHTYRTVPDDTYLKGTLDGVVNESKSYQQLWNRWDVDPAGNLWFASQRDQYLVQCATPEGVVIKSFTKEGFRPKRSAEAKMKRQKKLTEEYSLTNPPIVIGDHDPWINRLWITDTQWGCEIWVESAASFNDLPEGVMIRYDIFNTDGELRNQVDIHGVGDPLFDRWYVIEGKYLVMVRNENEGGFDFDDETNPRFDDTDLEVICYRILYEE